MRQRGLQHLVHVELEGGRRWVAYRQAVNGEVVAINKVEVDVQQERTLLEIQSLTPVVDLLPDFLNGRGFNRPTRYYLLADSLERPFSGQSQHEFTLMQDDMKRIVDSVLKSGGTIVRDADGVDDLVSKLDGMLPPRESSSASD
jgi:hypothetical protein